MTMDRHSASAGSAAVGGMRSVAACRRLRTSELAGACRASSKEPKGTVTDAGSAMESGSLPRSPALEHQRLEAGSRKKSHNHDHAGRFSARKPVLRYRPSSETPNPRFAEAEQQT